MNNIIRYILTFLLHGDESAAQKVGYTNDKTLWKNYKVVIVPNGFLAKYTSHSGEPMPPQGKFAKPEWTLPDMHTPEATPVEGTETTVIENDIVYNTLFFTSRAEELINPRRDDYGRFSAEHSFLGEGNRLMIPAVDEYSRLLMKQLNLPMPKNEFAKVYLTHDIDILACYRHPRGFIGGILRKNLHAALRSAFNLNNDPAYTFPWLIREDGKVKNAEVIYFVKDTQGKGYDYPQYNLHGKDWQRTQALLRQSGARIGYHSGFYGTEAPTRLNTIDYRLHRSHYLRSFIDHFQRLADAGVTDDFTMGFADRAGFRLQTSRPIRWFNPTTLQLTNLTLHPLIAMDATFDKYMQLTEDEAYFLCEELFDRVHMQNGELCLNWHNSNFGQHTYHYSLYPKLLQLI